MNLEITSTRHNPMIDPVLHTWGWEIPVYLFLGGLVAGILVLFAVRELNGRGRPRTTSLQWMPLVALGLLSLGMLALFLDLEYKAHVYRFYLAFMPASPMSWGAWILLLVYPAGLMLGLGSLSPGQRTWVRSVAALLRLRGVADRLLGVADRRRRPILWVSLSGGVALGVYTGVLLGSLAARPLWNSAVLGPLFLASGLSTAAAFLLLFRPREEDHRWLLRWDLAAIGIELGLIALLLIDLASGPAEAREAAGMLMGGMFSAPFWSLVVIAGLVVPLLMDLLELRKGLAPTVTSAVLVLVGGLSLRVVLTAAGQHSGFGVL